jgi:hypothetical protein
MTGVDAILEWLDSWGIPRYWPAGPPAPYRYAHATVRSRRLWACGGHFGASQVPCCLAAGPGAINVERLTGAPVSPARGVPLPREDGGPRVRPAAVSTMDGVHAEDDALARVG